MTLYLTDRTDPAEIDARQGERHRAGCKLYPAGATTHSDAGVTDIRRIDAVLARMAEVGLVLQVHGEVTDPQVDVFDREARFIDAVLAPLARAATRSCASCSSTSRRAPPLDFVRGARAGVARHHHAAAPAA